MLRSAKDTSNFGDVDELVDGLPIDPQWVTPVNDEEQQLFAAFPVRRLLPVSLSAAGANPVEWSTAFDATLANATALNATHEWWGAQAVIDMPAHLRWMRVPAAAAYVLVDTERCS